MELIRRLVPARARDCVVTIGSFDGLHRGHWALIERAVAQARELGLPAVMLSFEPLPREFLQRNQPPARLTNLRERWRLLRSSGLSRLWVMPFDARLRQLSGQQFMELLCAARARRLVVGHDFHFGRDGQASAEWCTASAAQYGFAVDVLPPVQFDGERVSSRAVREALARGDLARAQALLARPYAMRGRVRAGQRLGRTLGFPTANLPVKRRRVALQGVFAVRVNGLGLRGWPGVANLGTRPMVNGVEPLLEVHLFDFAQDLYGCELEVEFVERLRDEQTFASMDAMVLQIGRDAADARRLLNVQ